MREFTAPCAGIIVCGLALAGLAATPAHSAPADTVNLAAHRAVYELTLAKSRGTTKLVNVAARMVFELTGTRCAGYTQNMRIVTSSSTDDGNITLSDQRLESSEDADARAYRFAALTYRDEHLVDSSAGTASRAEAGDQDTRVTVTQPERRALAIGGQALFPVQHSIQLIDAARRGASLFNADIYDGSETADKVYATTTLIGKKAPAGLNKTLPRVAGAELLDKVAAWPVSISYFEQEADTKDRVPAYEIAFLMFENGVSRRLYMDYGDYALKGELKQITFLPQGKCN